MSRARSKISVVEVQELAQVLNLQISRLAPSWGWFEKMADGSRKLFAKTNDLAFEKLQEMLALISAQDKKMKLWHSTAPAAIISDAIDFDALGAIAPSKAGLIRMLDALFKCGPGTGLKSHRCRVRKYWQPNAPEGMEGALLGDPGVWVVKGGTFRKLSSSQ